MTPELFIDFIKNYPNSVGGRVWFDNSKIQLLKDETILMEHDCRNSEFGLAKIPLTNFIINEGQAKKQFELIKSLYNKEKQNLDFMDAKIYSHLKILWLIEEYIENDYTWKYPVTIHVKQEISKKGIAKDIWKCHPGTGRLYTQWMFAEENPYIEGFCYAPIKFNIPYIKKFEKMKDIWNYCIQELNIKTYSAYSLEYISKTEYPKGNDLTIPTVFVGEYWNNRPAILEKCYEKIYNFMCYTEVTTTDNTIFMLPLIEKRKSIKIKFNSNVTESIWLKAFYLMILKDKYTCKDFWFKRIDMHRVKR